MIFDHKHDTTQYLLAFLDCMGGGLDGTSHTTDRNSNPNVFNLERNGDELHLDNNWANPTNQWNLDNQFVFRLRKSRFSATLLVAVFLFRDY
jgi:hypothetical protein